MSRKAIAGVWLLANCWTIGLWGQEKAPEILRNAAHCLVQETFLPTSKDNELRLGFVLDRESYPGEQVLYVVSYPSSSRSKGFVFTVFLRQDGSKQTFDIQNNATYKRTRDAQEPVNFVGPPLGGTWTQQHITAAILRIESQPTFTIDVNDLRSVTGPISCESYTDRK